jgi:hypothetical protein
MKRDRKKKLDKKTIKDGKRPESNKAHNINNLTEKRHVTMVIGVHAVLSYLHGPAKNHKF